MTSPRRPRAPLITGLGAIIAVAMALPLLAPSCSNFQPGVKVFAKGSLIIPMDVCYQYQTDGVRASYTPSASCPGAVTDPGDVIKAYGLVYQLIRNGVAVYWIIDPAKTALTSPDLTLQYNAGFPVLEYDWSGAAPSVAPNTANHVIRYLGGPFVVDGSDAARAAQVFQKYKATFRPTATTGVNVHVSSVAFTASVAKMLAGGWSAGGATPPKLALLNIGSTVQGSGSKNSEVVIRGYLQKAGLDVSEPDPANPGVLLAAGGSATGVHGTIYDRLVLEDFIPSTPGDWTTTNLYRNGYQILWVPHWGAPGSCSDCPPAPAACPCRVPYTAGQIQQALTTIGAFGAAGKDVFAECAGLGSFEGVLNNSSYGTAVAGTHFQTTLTSPLVSALSININVSSTPIYRGSFSSPLMQLGDYPFIPDTGAIQNYKPGPSTPYLTGGSDATVQLISETNQGGAYDIFTHRPGLTAGHGTYVYLGGHSYSGTDGTFQIGGTRLVLNTLFNLGAGCTEGGVACDTGKPGRCARGVFKCVSGATQCVQVDGPIPETCNGIDDDCNGVVDDGLDQACYDGPNGTDGVGLCHGGVRSCVRSPDGSYGYTGCVGQVTPQPEVCNGLDDDCNGLVDENLTRSCYDGDPTTVDPATGLPFGACKPGISTCNSGSWGACAICTAAQIQAGNPPASCQILPRADPCNCPECGTGSGKDWDCNGQIDQCQACTPGTTQPCYSGPAGTAGVGLCHAGTQTCDALGRWGTCMGEVLPAPEICQNGIDENCNGMLDDGPPACGECTNGDTRPCYTGPAGTQDVGACKGGTQLCVNRTWAACGTGTPQTLPGKEICNGQDDDCNGTVDDGAQCGPGFACVNGVCVYGSCGPEIPCAEGYACVTGHCQIAGCGSGGPCPDGFACRNGACSDPNAGLTCGVGSSPAGGFCTGGACYEAGCLTGQVCLGGSCVTDLCRDVLCPGGAFCRQGDCVQACAFLTCPAGQRCDVDGFCVADTCAAVQCAPTQLCVAGACVADLCASVGCGRGQACQVGTCSCDPAKETCAGPTRPCATCVDDPCTGIACPAGQCQGGQCFATASLAVMPPRPTGGGGGCGCTSGGPGTWLALLGLLAFAPLARRRPRPRGGALLGLMLLAVAASGCKKPAPPFDPASCTASGVQVTACEGEARCVDLASDPSHCGSCGHACLAGQTCVDQVCGPSTSVAPFIATVSPVTLDRGALLPRQLSFTGQRFVAGATVRGTRSTGTTTYAANVIDAGNLSALVDLSDAPAETWAFRVVNPDRVISNVKQVPVVIPTPALASLSPGSAPIGAVATVTLVGTGLMVDSLCFLGGGTLLEQAVPSVLTGAGLQCQLDLSLTPPATYKLWVVNQTAGTPLQSNQLDFQATSNSALRLDSLAPSSGRVGTITSLSAFGAGFDGTSQVVFVASLPPAAPVELKQATAFRSTNELYVAQLDLGSCPGGPCPISATPGPAYSIKVTSGAASTGALPYTIVNTIPPAITSLSPASAFQGELVPVTVTGQTLTGGILQYRQPGGPFVDATTTSSTATSATGTIDLIGTPPGSRPSGSYDVRVRIGASGFTGSLPFTVISNTAILQSISPASGVQGQNPVAVTFRVPNLRPGAVTVRFSGAGADLPTSAVNATAVQASLDLRGLATDTFTLQVLNPNGAAPSNPANFTIRPGPPTLATVAPTSVSQQAGLSPVALTGTNFAKPDVSGANGSAIHIFANCTPVLTAGVVTSCTCACTSPADCAARPCISDMVLPSAFNKVTVTSPTRIDILFDPSSAALGSDATGAPIATAYSLWVWNPGGSPFQVSNQLLDAFTVTP